MVFIDKKAFYEHILKEFKWPRGSVQVYKAITVSPDDELYIFSYGPPFQRPGTETEFKGRPGIYALFLNDFFLSPKEIVKLTAQLLEVKVRQVAVLDEPDYRYNREVLMRLPDSYARYPGD
jgi:hypothetical protein